MYPLFGRKKEEFDGTIDLLPVCSSGRSRRTGPRHPLRPGTNGRLRCGRSASSIPTARFGTWPPAAGPTTRPAASYPHERRQHRHDREQAKRRRVEQAKETAEAANKAKDNFLAILSHELRTPLTPVLAAVAISKKTNDSAPRPERTRNDSPQHRSRGSTDRRFARRHRQSSAANSN